MPEITLRQLSDFDYALPSSRIAQFALSARSNARLMVVSRESGTIEHRAFSDIIDYFQAGDVLVLNDTKVIPARLFGKRKTGARVEILVMDLNNPCEALVKPSRRIHKDEELLLGDNGQLLARVIDEPDHRTGIRHLEFKTNENTEAILSQFGRIPLPPYIDRADAPIDRELYQTVFADRLGAVASPTAGLHFDQELLRRIELRGVEVLRATLHVSYGTFQPVQVEDLTQHVMYEERYEISDEVAKKINVAKREGRTITACGTTVVRTLESASSELPPHIVVGAQASTDLFIYPPYEFKVPNQMITNFHLPKSTLLMLTSAFAGYELLMRAYQEAIQEQYRFYSYGDAMLIL